MARTWTGVLARLGMPTGDGRIIAPGSLTNRPLPLPLSWQELSSDGHGGSMVVGTIDSIDTNESGMVVGTGRMLDSAPAALLEQLEAGVIGPSVDLDDVDYVMDDQERVVITAGRVAGATLVSIPAFADVSITLLEELGPGPVAEDLIDAVYGNEHSDQYPSLYASAAPVQRPPRDWFARPDLDRLTPLTVSNTGRVFGHLAGWNTCHVGLPGCVTAPRSFSNYAHFLLHSQAMDDGTELPVGVLTVGGGHAAAGLGWRPALEHYDNVGTAVAKVMVGEDEHGLWAAGWVLPQTTPEQMEVFRSTPISGDWREVGGNLELIAACSVNNPGFPIPRARVSFARGRQRTLIASTGLVPVEAAEPPEQAPVDDLRARWAWQRMADEI